MVSREREGVELNCKAGGDGNERVDQAPETIVSGKEASSSPPPQLKNGLEL